MNTIQQQISQLAQECLHDDSLFIVEVQVSTNPKFRKVLVLVDGDNGVSIEVCSKISRELGGKIEEGEIIADSYTLEVSSPGVDFPLNSPRLYKKNVGRSLKLQLADGKESKGALLEADEQGILLNEEVKAAKGKKIELQERRLSYTDIQKAIVTVSFK
ncbi:ribosome maturation factor RimP [Cytophagales bacterium LB-30]|uniref:Ribosome maturation factor RimP n=1 Tax=Shiella aurantiaca TaxID=3058365 RepID=A0ABT8F2C3_9BACT|nr:ribosome maturation factor RimP [Shiella aurantiaca]MDN4164509.1 ribosome maturation factor RimP [Shiella aurantiaca]